MNTAPLPVLLDAHLDVAFNALALLLTEHHPHIKIILTISPVRHIKDTIPLNAVSKSTLRVATHIIANQHKDLVQYFPAYEFLLDDLRDYRFYREDMIHPTAEAEEYIWDKWCEAMLTEKDSALLNQWKIIKQLINHKPLQPDSTDYMNHLSKILQKLKEVETVIDVSGEIQVIKDKLRSLG